MMIRRLLVVAVLVAVGAGTPAGAAPVLCKKKSGAIVARDSACKKKETPLDLAQYGAVTTTISAHTQNAQTPWPIQSSPTVVAVAGDLADYSGSYTAPLVQPVGVTYLVLNVQAHVRNVTGTGVSCALESRADTGAWTTRAQTAVSGSDGFLNTSFPSFTGGTSWAFRVTCQTSSGSGNAQGEIGVIGVVVVN